MRQKTKYRIAEAALMIGVHVETIKQWRLKKWIKCTQNGSRGWVYVSAKEIKRVREARLNGTFGNKRREVGGGNDILAEA